MKAINFILLCMLLLFPFKMIAQKSSFILLGDVHYDLIENHNLSWVKENYPNDIKQIADYTAITKNNWDDFMKHLRFVVKTNMPEIKGVVQSGDLSEGLAGDDKADQQAKSVMKAIDKSNLGIPWIITKGNHDITSGTAAKKAFNDHYIPMIRKQTGNFSIHSANYTYRIGNIEFFVVDYYERNDVDPLIWLDSAARSSTAKVKFAVFHEPVIPVTERVWNMYRKDDVNRQRLLKIMATNKLIALVGHLHRYSVARRETECGPVVQIMTSSVIENRDEISTSIITQYGPSLAENSSFEPSTVEFRKAYLKAEQPFVTYYKQCSLQGYGILQVDETTNNILLKYYGGFSDVPFDTVDISSLMHSN